MLNLVTVFLICHGALQAFLFVGLLLSRKKNRKVDSTPNLSLSDLTVIVPFRNEELRLSGLLKSIENQVKHPSKYLFVNDHSDDSSSELIHHLMKGTFDYEIIDLTEDKSGKKTAIRTGINVADTSWILTMDADVKFHNSYFEELSNVQPKELNVLPVIMNGGTLGMSFLSSDYNLSSFVNDSAYGWFRPIMASGANFLFKKKVFLEVDSIDNHKQYASGDDMFLLKDFRVHKKSLQNISLESVKVTTEPPSSVIEFVIQRLRWIGKNAKINDGFANGIGTVYLINQFGFVFILTTLMAAQNWELIFIFFGIKTGIDLLVLMRSFFRFKLYKLWVMYPLFQLVLPIISLFVLITGLFYRPEWKGRGIKTDC